MDINLKTPPESTELRAEVKKLRDMMAGPGVKWDPLVDGAFLGDHANDGLHQTVRQWAPQAARNYPLEGLRRRSSQFHKPQLTQLMDLALALQVGPLEVRDGPVDHVLLVRACTLEVTDWHHSPL